MTQGPDFLCIGLPKAGTTWLFDQLRQHPDFWMPPSKELHYLEHEKPALQNTVDMFRRAQNRGRRSRQAPHYFDDVRDFPFLELSASIAGKAWNLESYASLFLHKGNALSGDITPTYAALPEKIIEQVALHFPELRIAFFARDPVARAWSHVCQLHREGRILSSALENAGCFHEFLGSNPALRNLSFPSRIQKRWLAAAPRLRFQTFLFDDLANRPTELRRAVLEFLDANPDRPSGDLPKSYNRKANKPRPQQSAAIGEVLVRHFAEELRSCADLFGGPARGWPARYGLKS